MWLTNITALNQIDTPMPPRLALENIIEVIRAARPDVRESDRKVANLVLLDPHRGLGLTVAETARFAASDGIR